MELPGSQLPAISHMGFEEKRTRTSNRHFLYPWAVRLTFLQGIFRAVHVGERQGQLMDSGQVTLNTPQVPILVL